MPRTTGEGFRARRVRPSYPPTIRMWYAVLSSGWTKLKKAIATPSSFTMSPFPPEWIWAHPQTRDSPYCTPLLLRTRTGLKISFSVGVLRRSSIPRDGGTFFTPYASPSSRAVSNWSLRSTAYCLSFLRILYPASCQVPRCIPISYRRTTGACLCLHNRTKLELNAKCSAKWLSTFRAMVT